MTSTVKEIHLSVVDQSLYRQYEQNLIIFPFEDISNASAAIQTLRTALSSALRQFPFLTGTLELSDSATGILKASYSDPIRRDHGDVMLTSSMVLASDPKLDYAVMEKAGFPPAMLPSYAFCPLDMRSHAGLANMEDPYAEKVANTAKGYRLPIMFSQATFIPGGLVLSVYVHHSVMDGRGIDRLLEQWSRGVRHREELFQHTNHLEELDDQVFDTSIARLALDAIAHECPGNIATDCPEMTTKAKKPSKKSLHPGPYQVEAKILCISAARILALRSELRAHTTTCISTFVTIAALIWTHITRARSVALNTQGHSTTTLGMVFETRARIKNAVLKDSMGNMSLSAAVSSSIPDMLQPTPDLVSTAVSIVSTLDLVDESWFAQRIKFIASISDPRTFRHAHTYVNGPDLFINSWQHLYVNWIWNIPGTSADGKASAVRKPAYLSEGGVRILPRKNDGDRDYELLVCLEEGEMQRLLEGLGDVVGRVVDASPAFTRDGSV